MITSAVLGVAAALVLALAVYVAVALALIASERIIPPGANDNASPFDFDPSQPRYRPPTQPLETYIGDGGAPLFYRHYRTPNGDDNGTGMGQPPLLVFIHGSTNYGAMYEPLARMIAQQGVAEVVLPDLRGHGEQTPLPQRGIAEHGEQLEADLAALIAHVNAATPQRPVVVGGHSLGGGFAIRFASGRYAGLVSAAFLLAPFLSTRAPSQRPKAGGFTRVMRRRAAGQLMLRLIGAERLFAIHRLPVVQFNFDAPFRAWERGWLSTDRYNYAMIEGLSPRQNWRADIAKLPPFLVVVGGRDEVFFAEKIAPTMQALSARGTYVLLPDQDHIDVSQEQSSVDALAAFLRQALNVNGQH